MSAYGPPLNSIDKESKHVQCLDEAGFGFSGVGGALLTEGTQKQSKYPIPTRPSTGPRISISSNTRPVIAPKVLLTLLLSLLCLFGSEGEAYWISSREEVKDIAMVSAFCSSQFESTGGDLLSSVSLYPTWARALINPKPRVTTDFQIIMFIKYARRRSLASCIYIPPLSARSDNI